MKINWHHEKRKIDELKMAEYNPRKMSDYQRGMLKNSIEEDGLAVPLTINLDGTVIAGHQRLTELLERGENDVDVWVPDKKLPKDKEKKLNLRLNKISGEFDVDKLFGEEFDLQTILESGFEEKELSNMFDDVTELYEDEFDVEKEKKKITIPTAKYGDIYQLGDHVLMCGDSTKEDDVKTAMGELKAEVIYCDPPYNIGLDYASGVTTKGKYKETKKGSQRKEGDQAFPDLEFKGFKVNDSKTLDAYDGFIAQTLNNALQVSKPDVHIFYWCDQNYIHAIQRQYIANGITPRRVALWIKNNFNLTPQIAFNKCYEPCVYGTIGTPWLSATKNLNEILNREVATGNRVHDEIMSYFDIWLNVREATQSYDHPTQKPISLHEKPLKRVSAPGNVILDLFGGSGSTMMACEQLKRINVSIERDPIFVELIIRRWEKMTGKKSKKLTK